MSDDHSSSSKAVAAAAAAAVAAVSEVEHAPAKQASQVQQNIDKANEHKNKGNQFVASENFAKASFEYKHVNLYLKQYLQSAGGVGDGIAEMVSKGREGAKPTKNEMEAMRAVMYAAQCNLSLAQLKLGKPQNALTAAQVAIDVAEAAPAMSNVKARYRRAHARLQIGLVDEAAEDFQAVLAQHPDDAGAQTGMEQVRVALAHAKAKEAKMCAKMFA